MHILQNTQPSSAVIANKHKLEIHKRLMVYQVSLKCTCHHINKCFNMNPCLTCHLRLSLYLQ